MLGFDALHLLRDGRDVYTGRAAGAVTALAAASGVEKPPGVPAADFLLDVVCAGAPAPPAASELDAVEEEALADVGPDAPLPWRRQYALLLRRCFLAHRLDLVDPMFMANVFSIMILATCLWSGEAAKRPRDETSVRDAAGLLFLAPVYWAFQIMITSLQTYGARRGTNVGIGRGDVHHGQATSRPRRRRDSTTESSTSRPRRCRDSTAD